MRKLGQVDQPPYISRTRGSRVIPPNECSMGDGNAHATDPPRSPSRSTFVDGIRLRRPREWPKDPTCGTVERAHRRNLYVQPVYGLR